MERTTPIHPDASEHRDLRPLAVADVDAVAALLADDVSKATKRVATAAEMRPVVQKLAEAPTGPMISWVLRDAPQTPIRAVVVAHRFTSAKHLGECLWIDHLYVDPASRQRGYGREVLSRLKAWCRRQRIVAIDLETPQLNTPAAILYRSEGFRRVGQTERFSISLPPLDSQ